MDIADRPRVPPFAAAASGGPSACPAVPSRPRAGHPRRQLLRARAADREGSVEPSSASCMRFRRGGGPNAVDARRAGDAGFDFNAIMLWSARRRSADRRNNCASRLPRLRFRVQRDGAAVVHLGARPVPRPQHLRPREGCQPSDRRVQLHRTSRVRWPWAAGRSGRSAPAVARPTSAAASPAWAGAYRSSRRVAFSNAGRAP